MLRWSFGDVTLRFSALSFIYLLCTLCLSPAIISKPLTITLRPFLSRAPAGTSMHSAGTHISPPSILFNPNLSHSALNKAATTWSSFRSDRLTLQSQKQDEELMLLPANSPCDKHIFRFFALQCLHFAYFLLILWMQLTAYFAYASSAARFDICLDMTHSRPPASRFNCSQSVRWHESNSERCIFCHSKNILLFHKAILALSPLFCTVCVHVVVSSPTQVRASSTAPIALQCASMVKMYSYKVISHVLFHFF